MRSHRTQKKMLKDATATVSFADDFIFSKYQTYTVKEEDATGFKTLGAYVKPADSALAGSSIADAGIKAISDFSEELKWQRRGCIKDNQNKTITVNLAYLKTDSGKYKCVNLIFTYKQTNNGAADSEADEEAEINVEVIDPDDDTKTLTLKTPPLTLDSDITEYLFRFTKGLSWGSVTYGILDCNPNESVNKGIYLTLNAPFNGSIEWGDEVRKLILAYKLTV